MVLTLPGCVFWKILLLLHTAHSVTHKVITPVHQITAVAGESLVLPCYINPNISAEGWTVEWFNLNLSERSIYLNKDGKENCEAQNPSFRTRASLFKEELKTGNISLKLVGVRGTDEGTYKCSVWSPTSRWHDDSNITVSVKAVGSQPVVSIEGHRGAGMGLVCETQGWYPQPEVVWRDSEGVSLSADPPETTTDSLGLHTLRLRVTVQKTDRNPFNCRVKQKYMERDETARIHVPEQLFGGNECLEKQKDTLSRQLDLVNTRGYQVDVTLDPDTAYPRLILSDDGKQVSCGVEHQDLPETPVRYDQCPDVLGKQGFSSGRFYYEVQVNKTEWHLGVAKESCKRNGIIHLFPHQGYWTIGLENYKYLALTEVEVHLHLSKKPQKVGVFVDYEKGTVSFYNVEARSHIYSFTGCCFKEKLHPFFSSAPPGFSGENSAPLIICSVDNVQPESPHPSESQADFSDSAHLSESQANESDSAHQSSLNQGQRSESSEQINESVRLLEHSASYKV